MDNSIERTWSLAQLYEWVPEDARSFEIIICAGVDTPGTLWTRDFCVEVDYELRVVRFGCEPT